MPHDILISHSSRDAGVAADLCARLEAAGVSCWMAPRDIRGGLVWADAIVAAIAQAPAVVVLVSSSSVGSRPVLNEVTEAGRTGAVLLPLRLENVPLPDALRFHLGASQWLDAFGGLAPTIPALVKVARDARRARDQRDAVRGHTPEPVVDPSTQHVRGPQHGAASKMRLIAGAGAIALVTAGYVMLRPTGRPPDNIDASLASSSGGRVSVASGGGIVLSVAPGSAWRVDSAESAQVLTLRSRQTPVVFLAGFDVDAPTEPAAFARAWLGRFATTVPGPLVAGTPVPVGAGEWDVPLFRTSGGDANTRDATGVLRLLHVPAGDRVAARWWAAVGETPAALRPRQDDVSALVASLRADAGSPNAAAPSPRAR